MNNQCIWGDCIERGRLGQFADLRRGVGGGGGRGVGKKRQGLIPQCILCVKLLFFLSNLTKGMKYKGW